MPLQTGELLPEVYDQVMMEEESAWAAGMPFPGANWATYFDYTIQCVPLVSEGQDPRFTAAAGVRYKSFGNTGSREIYLGVPDLGIGGNRVETDFTWQSPGTHQIEFSYDGGDKIYTKVDATELTYDFMTMPNPVCDPEDWNALEISITIRDSGAKVNLNMVDLDGFPLGSFEGDEMAPTMYWTVSNYDFSLGFKVTGTIELDGIFSFPGGSELSKIELYAGCKDCGHMRMLGAGLGGPRTPIVQD